MSLKETLEKYSKSNMYPFHMPGHKRRLKGCYEIDMTEVPGVDDLHDPEDVIFQDQKRMAKLYGADESYFLVGGSTVGNLAALYATCSEGDTVIIQRNSHKSVYNSAMLRHLKVEYICPRLFDNGIYQAVSLEEVHQAVEKAKNPRAIVLTSPTYEGYHCKIKEIADYCHEKEIILVVDQAHGAHLGFHPSFTNSAVKYADITIQSLHKTLPALTQTAVMHVSQGRVDLNRLREALDIYESSSPSYVLMNSISQCMDILEEGVDLFENYVDKLQNFYKACGQLKHLKVVEDTDENKDPGKLIISTKNTNITGVELARILREKYELETELSSFSYVLAMTSIMDSEEGFLRLEKALLEIDENLTTGNVEVPRIDYRPTKKIELYEAKSNRATDVKLEDAINKVSAAMVCIYPPGAPLIVPGEEISTETVDIISFAKAKGLHVTGLNKGLISVVN
ncbi:Arginine/lysine/ornithine decarboxylase [Pseudobutyrivibrio sp. YE44]|uniref:aminotransferase class I/II-fold pyridoxal phosphate-dependent enzyme n=1 Tax=Pseudobutyrivibrio sp. YE44 TaxID=1520802 RepID=UPI00088A10FE|nr:aminotransferase class I/II-fold pyridoxal phosphate-dependent enzyme [Pseudobutyrivibrio sp. YE44]SDB44531.1 Arginine/lysine/ornithine decarboxylase [Pseudobutyrivibrio sp. YE44]